jgi:hypothetical protein
MACWRRNLSPAGPLVRCLTDAFPHGVRKCAMGQKRTDYTAPFYVCFNLRS